MIHFNPEITDADMAELIKELVIYEEEKGNSGDLHSLGLELQPSRDTVYGWDDLGDFF